jgi:cell division septum initiation protein DivIVA
MPNPPADRPDAPGLTRPVATPPGGIDDSAFETVGQTVRHAAGALEGLRDILERLETSIAKAVDQRRTEEQIGELFVRAQEYVDRSIFETEERARIVVAEAEHEASRIISAARGEAQRLIDDARRSARLPAEAARQLQATIDGFGQVNSELLRELTALSQTLTRQGQPQHQSDEDAHQHLSSPSTQIPSTSTADSAPGQSAESDNGYWSKRPSPASPSLRVQTNRLGGSPR